MPPPIKSDAQKAYEAFVNGTDPAQDPMRKGVQANVRMAMAIADVLNAQTLVVGGVADDMTRIRDYMSKLNDVTQLAGPAAAGTGVHYTVFTGTTKEDVLKFRAAFLITAQMGIGKPNDYVAYTDTPPDKYEWGLTVEECATALKNLQFAVDNLNSVSQQDQLLLNTMMTNLNAQLEAATSGLQKVGTQGQSALRAFGG